MTSLNRRGLWLGVLVGSVPLFAMVNGCGPEMPEQTKDAGVMMGTDAGTKPEPETDAGMQTPTDAGMQTPTDAGMQMPTDAGVSFSKQIQPILNGCGVACHKGAMPSGGLPFAADLSYAALVNADLEGPCANQPNFKRVIPGNPSTSMLYLKIMGTQGCGQPMPPFGSTLLPDAQRTLIRMWIEEGAKKN